MIGWNGNERHYADASATREFGQHFIPMPMLEISSVSGTIEQGGRLLQGTYDMVIALNLIYERGSFELRVGATEK